jgi:hypothetical protein
MQTKEIKVAEANARKIAYAKLSTEEKIQLLDDKFGKGKGANKQRIKLIGQLISERAMKAAK